MALYSMIIVFLGGFYVFMYYIMEARLSHARLHVYWTKLLVQGKWLNYLWSRHVLAEISSSLSEAARRLILRHAH